MKAQYQVLIGMDWGDRKHAMSICYGNNQNLERITVAHKAKALKNVFSKIRQKTSGKISVCLEQSKGSLVNFLRTQPQVEIRPVNPQAAAQFRKALFPNGNKNDCIDGDVLLKMIQCIPERLGKVAQISNNLRKMGSITEVRRKIVDERTRITNYITSILKEYYPIALEMFAKIDSPLACSFLEKWSDFSSLKAATKEDIITFYKSNRCPNNKLITQRLELIAQSDSITDDLVAISVGTLQLKAFLPLLQHLMKVESELSEQCTDLFENEPDKLIFSSFPASGKNLAPRLANAFGSDRSRFDTAEAAAAAFGIAPIQKQSGNSNIVKHRRATHLFTKQTFMEYANVSIQRCQWAKAFYAHKRSVGKEHNVAIRALAFKWIRIMFICWKNNTPYNEALHIQHLLKQPNNAWIKHFPLNQEKKL